MLRPSSVSSQRSLKASLTNYFDGADTIAYMQRNAQEEIKSKARRLSVVVAGPQAAQPSKRDTSSKGLVDQVGQQVKKKVRKVNKSFVPRWLSGDEIPWVVHHNMEHTIVDSVWSFPLVIGLIPVGRVMSILLFMLVSLNALMQVTSHLCPPLASPPSLAPASPRSTSH